MKSDVNIDQGLAKGVMSRLMRLSSQVDVRLRAVRYEDGSVVPSCTTLRQVLKTDTAKGRLYICAHTGY
jgi:hypothetical protein